MKNFSIFIILGFFLIGSGDTIAQEYMRNSEFPYTLSERQYDALFSEDTTGFTEGYFVNLGAIAIRLGQVKWGRASLEVRLNPQLNLGLGLPDHATDGQGGQANIIIQSVTAKDGKDVYKPKPHPHEFSILSSLRTSDEGYLETTREVPLSSELTREDIAKIEGTVMLELPISVEMIKINVQDFESGYRVQEFPQILFSSLQNNRLSIEHPAEFSRLVVAVLGYDQNDERIKVIGTGYAGRVVDNRWYQFFEERELSLIKVFVARKILTREMPFTITTD